MFTILMIMEVTCCQIMVCPGFQVQMTVVNNTPAMGNVGNNFILLIKWALTLYCTTNCIDNIFSNLHPDLPCYSYRIIQIQMFPITVHVQLYEKETKIVSYKSR